MEKKIIIQHFNDTNIEIYGTYEEPLFKAKDICDLLGIEKNDDSTFLTEDELDEILFTLQTPEAKQFRIWVRGIIKEILKKGNQQKIKEKDQLLEETLKKYQTQFKEMDTKDIAREQFTTTQNIALNVSALVAMGRLRLGREAGQLGKTLDDVFGKDLETGIRAQRDKIIGKSSDSEVQKAFGETNKPTSNNVNPTTTPQKSVPVDNSKQQPTNTPTTSTEAQSNKTEVTLNVKSDPIMDEFSRYIVRRPETIDAFLNGTSSRDYTSQA
jgi:prophage antirepressor-like protein